MKPYEDLTPVGRMRRLRPAAAAALDAYGFGKARITAIRQAGNTLFRIDAAKVPPTEAEGDMYCKGRYLLRIHQPGYQTTGGLQLELAWLAAMSRDAGLPVPEPVTTLDGGLTTRVSAPGIPEVHDCSLLRWLKGRFMTKRIRPHHYRAQGRLMGRLHDFAARWLPPPGLTKRCYDWDGLFRDDSGCGIPAGEVWPLLPRHLAEPFEAVARKVERLMNEWGKGPDVYGLIHADLGVDANVIFHGGEARAIDFDDSGFGYWIYDLAVALEHCWEDADYHRFRDALLGGYAEIRSLPEDQLGCLDLFTAAFCVHWSLWATGLIHLNPEYRDRLRRRLARYAGHVKRYVAGP